ncbi:MAG: nucleotidyltransferase domain-containing protein [Candidatus Margulisbacteria bacterium]|jgi:predicted nucleotidyltransferase|nr:nucleotidyltransferase domain-containing protein [Candidatus Margulisiibacteriota bacterium]
MNKKVQEQIEIVKKIIVETVPVKQIYLFGSYVYGTPRENSDLDFYVVMKDDAPYRQLEAKRLIGAALWDKKTLPIDILLNTNTRFQYRKSAHTIERKVAEKGIVIYG